MPSQPYAPESSSSLQDRGGSHRALARMAGSMCSGPDRQKGGQGRVVQQGIVHAAILAARDPGFSRTPCCSSQPERVHGRDESSEREHGAPAITPGQVARRQRGEQKQLVAVRTAQHVVILAGRALDATFRERAPRFLPGRFPLVPPRTLRTNRNHQFLCRRHLGFFPITTRSMKRSRICATKAAALGANEEFYRRKFMTSRWAGFRWVVEASVMVITASMVAAAAWAGR